MNAETYRIDLSHVIDRMHEEYGKKIFCGEGWYQLIWDLDYQLALIDPDYTIFQIKEKYGDTFPSLLKSDPISRFYGYNKGDIIKVTRKNGIVIHRIVK